jgi:hypothetical protein
MNYEHPDQSSPQSAVRNSQPPASPPPGEATVLVRGETVRNQEVKSPPGNTQTAVKEKAPKAISEAKTKLQGRLPALDDDGDIGAKKDHIVVRDGKADLAFNGTLLASAAPATAIKGKWQEYRVYETNGGQYVFSKKSRSVYVEDQDDNTAEVFEPSPTSAPSQLLRGARDLVRSQPVTWKDAAVDFFGYDPLAKELYRKLGDQFEEHIS